MSEDVGIGANTSNSFNNYELRMLSDKKANTNFNADHDNGVRSSFIRILSPSFMPRSQSLDGPPTISSAIERQQVSQIRDKQERVKAFRRRLALSNQKKARIAAAISVAASIAMIIMLVLSLYFLGYFGLSNASLGGDMPQMITANVSLHSSGMATNFATMLENVPTSSTSLTGPLGFAGISTVPSEK